MLFVNGSYYQYWGKAGSSSDAESAVHLLPYHNLDVAACGQVFLNRNIHLAERIASIMQMDVKVAIDWVVYLLGLHDIGKHADSFQHLRPDVCGRLNPSYDGRVKAYDTRHDTLGWVCWHGLVRKKLCSQTISQELKDFYNDIYPFWLKPIFGHHGVPPRVNNAVPRHYFSDHNKEAIDQFISDWEGVMKPELSVVEELMTDSQWQQDQVRCSWLLAGVAVLSDWLGSNTDHFTQIDKPLDSLENYWKHHALPGAKAVVNATGIAPAKLSVECSFKHFFPKIESPSPLQNACQALQLDSRPQLIILEDVTGAGKTEAALILAHRLMSSGAGQGLFIGMPTMATANAMYSRMHTDYRRFFASEASPGLVLGHSARHLVDKFQDSVLPLHESVAANGNDAVEKSGSAQCNEWLADSNKKALLADVGVGTIDQALLSVLPARHQSLRMLGLSTKVLVLDEVHAYDAYTSELLYKLLEFQASIGASTVLLSATLTQKQRRKMAHAYSGSQQVDTLCNEYPLLTQAVANRELYEQPVKSRAVVSRHVEVQFVHSIECVLEIIQSTIKTGQCLCWIRNTVADVRAAYQLLLDSGVVDSEKLLMFHSRFAMVDRLNIEHEVDRCFGIKSDSKVRQGRVLIASQVVEQSLDIDFDQMITDLAPIDLAMQRAGRLKRHTRSVNGDFLETGEDQRGKAVLTVLSPEHTTAPTADWYKVMFPKAHYVYRHTLVLWRTAQALHRTGGWNMPSDARTLLEEVYSEEGALPEGLMDNSDDAVGVEMAEQSQGQYQALNLARGYTHDDHWGSDERELTRLGEDSVTVFLARWSQGQLYPWCKDGQYPWDMSSVRVSARKIKDWVPDDAAQNTAVDACRASERRLNEYSHIIPLTETGMGQCSSIPSASSANKTVHYCTTSGLIFHSE